MDAGSTKSLCAPPPSNQNSALKGYQSYPLSSEGTLSIHIRPTNVSPHDKHTYPYILNMAHSFTIKQPRSQQLRRPRSNALLNDNDNDHNEMKYDPSRKATEREKSHSSPLEKIDVGQVSLIERHEIPLIYRTSLVLMYPPLWMKPRTRTPFPPFQSLSIPNPKTTTTLLPKLKLSLDHGINSSRMESY